MFIFNWSVVSEKVAKYKIFFSLFPVLFSRLIWYFPHPYKTSERDHSTTVCSLSERDHSTTVYVRCPRETIQLQSMFVVQERPFNYILCSLSERNHSTTVYVRCSRETIQLQSMFVVRERLFNYSLFAVRERPFNYSLCSLSERDHSTTFYVCCSRESHGNYVLLRIPYWHNKMFIMLRIIPWNSQEIL